MSVERIMRRFFRLSLDSKRTDLKTSTRPEWGTFEYRRFWSAESFDAEQVKSLRFWVNRKTPPDLLGGTQAALVCSERLVSILCRWCVQDIEVFRAPVFLHDTKMPVDGYWLVNSLRKIDCLNRAKSKMRHSTILGKPHVGVFVGGEAINADAVPASTHLFRIPECSSGLFVSEELEIDMSNYDLQGVSLRPTMDVLA
jgi:hypothetical protein